ncbi:MAG TPA: lipocalin family protein, partial [Gammaproteobacteria bacterium]
MRAVRVFAIALLALAGGCAMSSTEPLRAIDRKVDLERFMGDWYVIASIPIDFWFASEAGAHNGVETYALREDGRIQTTYTFRQDGFDGEEKQFNPVGWVHNTETNAEWRMQFLWPFRSAYLIAYLDEDYQHTIIGVPERSHVWIMSRTPDVSDSDYDRLVAIVADLGHDTNLLQRVPQRW